MTITTTTSDPVDTTGAPTSGTVVALGCVLAALGAIAYISVVAFFGEDTPREDYANPLGVAGSAVATVGLIAIVYALLHQRILGPGWAVASIAGSLFFVAAQTWFFATGVLSVAEHTTDAAFDEIGEGVGLAVWAAPKMILGLVGFGALAISGWRQGILPRGATALLGLAAALSFFPPFPPGVLVASIAIFVAARSSPPATTRRRTA